MGGYAIRLFTPPNSSRACSTEGVRVSRVEVRGLHGLCFDYTGGRGAIVHKIRSNVDGLVVIKHKHDPEDRDDARRNLRDKILREAPGLIDDATG